jgi:hypothetical protein
VTPTAQPTKIPPGKPIRKKSWPHLVTPTSLAVEGSLPIHARVLPYGGSVLIPPHGDYVDAFLWTQRRRLPDGRPDAVFLFGHTYSGPTPGVFDPLQQEPKGTRITLTGKTGNDRYCINKPFPAAAATMASDPRIWAPSSLRNLNQYLVIITCLLNQDGSLQTGKRVITVAERC